MEVCPSTVLNSDASENVAYNNPDFPAYVKKGQLSSYPDFRTCFRSSSAGRYAGSI